MAVEIELKLKLLPHHKSILLELKEDYNDVWYFAPPNLVEDLVRVIREVDLNDEVFSIYSLVRDNFEVADRVV